MQLESLTPDNIELVARIYQHWQAHVSYYFSLDVESLSSTLFVQPQVHPAQFDICAEASYIAVEAGEPVGWLQAGYVSRCVSVEDGRTDALIRCLMVSPGRGDIAAALLDKAIEQLKKRPVHGWRAFEHNSGYTFATGMGRAPRRMTQVMQTLTAYGFVADETNFVYATDRLKPFERDELRRGINIDIRPKSWKEARADVDWDAFRFYCRGEEAGYAIVVPVGRLTGNCDETTLFVKGIAVDPAHQRKRLGHLIMQTLWDYYQPHGIRRIILNTGDENTTAQRFYEAIQFDLTDRISSFFTDAYPNH